MTNAKYLVVVLLLFCLRDCSCNNSDPCLNNPNPNLVVPFRQVVTTNSYLLSPYGEEISIYDSTNCYLLTIFSYSTAIYQFESSVNTPSSQAIISGYLQDTCNNGQQLNLAAFEYTNTALLNFPSATLSPVNVSPLFLQGSLSNGSYTWTANVTMDAAIFTSNISNPSDVYQNDEYVTFDNSPCTIRIRSDSVYRASLYSPNTPLRIQLYNGVLLQFTYPANHPAVASRTVTQKYYQQCTCAESSSDAQATTENQYKFTPPTIAGVRTSLDC